MSKPPDGSSKSTAQAGMLLALDKLLSLCPAYRYFPSDSTISFRLQKAVSDQYRVCYDSKAQGQTFKRDGIYSPRLFF